MFCTWHNKLVDNHELALYAVYYNGTRVSLCWFFVKNEYLTA